MLQRAIKVKSYFSKVSFLKNLTFSKSQEEFVLDILSQNREKGIIVDIGLNRNIGVDKIACKYPKYHFNVYEPIPQKARIIRNNAADLSLQNVKVFEYTLGDEEGQICMSVPLGEEQTLEIGYSDLSVGEVSLFFEMKKMDMLSEIKNSEQPIVGIRVNLKNYVWVVLEGAKKVLKKHKPVIFCELEEGEDVSELPDILNEMDYCILTFEKDRLKVHDQLNENLKKVIFIHRTFLLYANIHD